MIISIIRMLFWNTLPTLTMPKTLTKLTTDKVRHEPYKVRDEPYKVRDEPYFTSPIWSLQKHQSHASFI